jgi:hypothetical protein
VLGLEDTLAFHIGIPNQVSETLPVAVQPNQPGVYRVELLLPRSAPYAMELLGNVRGQQVQERFASGQDGLEQVVAHGRVYPKGAGFVVLFTFGFYLVGLAVLLVRAEMRRRRRHRRQAAGAGG